VTFPIARKDNLEGGDGKAPRLVAADDQSIAIRFKAEFTTSSPIGAAIVGKEPAPIRVIIDFFRLTSIHHRIYCGGELRIADVRVQAMRPHLASSQSGETEMLRTLQDSLLGCAVRSREEMQSGDR
jgi:hypothetical protein